jgi:very-short-patch-repair endonuclease
MSAPVPSLDTSLIRWRNNLIDLTRRNPLLALRPSRSSYLEIAAPALDAVFDHLVPKNKTFTFWLPPSEEEGEKKKNRKQGRKEDQSVSPPVLKPTELLAAETDRQRLLQILTNLYRRFQTDYRERGLHILYLAAGVLEWRDADEEPLRSPLVLVPVLLKRKSLQEPFLLDALEEEPFLNPALAARLKQDFDFSLPSLPEDWQEKTIGAYLADVAAAIHGLPGWKVEPVALLSLFSFFKGVIFQDLLENAERVKAHALVQALAGLPTAFLRAEVPSERELDDRQEPAETYHILDADSSQSLCLEAVSRQESFVLIGPPGTGKSQTIANLIADHVARGKRVLFVSEKMAALEVVYERLRHVGLGDFCLELHSHKASKRAVVAELARCLDERQKPTGANAPAGATILSGADFAKLKERRAQVNRYVRALHVVREPMRRSAWDVLAELPRWNHVAPIPLGLPLARSGGATGGGLSVTDITPTQLDDLKQMLDRLKQLWHVRADGSYPWKGFKADRFTLQLRDEVVGLIDRIRGRIDKFKSAANQYAAKLGVQGPVNWLLKLGEVLEARPGPVPVSWLREADFPGLKADLDRCADQYQRLGQARAPLMEKYGQALWNLPQGTAAKVEDAWRSAAKWLAADDDQGTALMAGQQKLRAWAADTLKKLPGWITEARTLEKWLAVPVPVGMAAERNQKPVAGESRLDPSPRALRQLLRLAGLCMVDHAPERPWAQQEDVLKEVQALVTANRAAFASYHERRRRLLQTYDEQFFELELGRIAEGYAGPYLSWFRVFNGRFRRDRRAIKRRTRKDIVPDTVAEDVTMGRDMLADKIRLEGEAPRRQKVLGRYEKGMETDWEAVDRATKVTAEAIQLSHQLGSANLPARLVDALCATAPPTEKIRAAFKRLNDSFASWQHATNELKGLLPLGSVPSTGEELDECALSAIVNYAKDLQAALNALGGLTDPVLTRAPAVPASLASFVADLHQAEELRVWEASQDKETARWTERLGSAFQGINTNWEDLRKGLNWTRRLRECFDSSTAGYGNKPVETAVAEKPNRDGRDALPIPPENLVTMCAGAAPLPAVRDLRQAQEQYAQTLHGFENRFDAPGPLLEGKPYGEQPPETVHQHLTHLRERVGELSDWIDYRHLPDRFAHLGLRAFWDSLQKEPPPPDQVALVFLKSFWSSWIEAVFRQDQVLSGFRRAEHERLLTEFQSLDRELVLQGAARVTQHALTENPLDRFADACGLLYKEAHKKTKHLPLRRLFDVIPGLVSSLKPCLLMSPLSVSQFLPADSDKMQFDVVVFDEASQILPEDALGAIYRGKQVVITGDNQQLPPTTFFQQMAGDDGADEAEDETPLFESVLDASLGAGLPRKLLRWHYRSRHEHLIAFSNQRFYEGRLVTFPAAWSDGPGLGVKFHHVPDGIYDRGGRRDNPREAQVVADLVFDHFQQTPDLTLGIIAFSYAQMNAIEDEIERRLHSEPGMERFFHGDRLEGFFVKNLETVQGDERDVIVLSVGYGKDAQGKMALNFGPLNREGGARRLNVAVTRARRKLILVSSIQVRDLEGSASETIGHLRQYLDFAQRGVIAIQPNRDSTAGEAGHGLETEVRGELTKLGYECVPQVGCGAYRIDLGVVDPKHAGRFLMGIEFDGPSYNQAGTARDRDRLRPEVLRQLGWNLHRIWSPDWLYRREEVVERLAQALAAAKNDEERRPNAERITNTK